MDFKQSGHDGESFGPGSNIVGKKHPKSDRCEICLLGIKTFWGGQKEVEMKDMLASGENCRACAGIAEWLQAQTSLLRPKELRFAFGPLHAFPTMTPYVLVVSEVPRPENHFYYEFFTASEGPDDKERETIDRPLSFSDSPMIWRMRAPSGDTSSTEAFDTLKGWISRCREEHSLCQPAEDTEMPHRVLEIESIRPLRVRVVEDCPRRERYACLSYRWGSQTESNSLKTHNVDLYKTEVPEDKLCLLTRDAIEAAFRLGLRLIWIDCYCIIQDDTKDWERAAANMASIYENAFLTISATSSEGGCPMFSCLEQIYAGTEVTRIRGESVFMRRQLRHPCLINNTHKREVLKGPLLERGWVFQERLLSNRVVHFTQDEIFWECREKTWCECKSEELEWLARRKETPRLLGSESWAEIVSQYNKTELTFTKDRLPALAGVARRYGKQHGKTYLAGVWKEDLPGALVWVVGAGDAQPRPLQHVAPTWSWASLLHPNQFYYYQSWASSPNIRFLGCNIQPHDADIYAAAHHLEITLEGPVMDVKIYKDGDWLVATSGNAFLKIFPDFEVDPQDHTKYRAVPDGSSCLLLVIFRDTEDLRADDIWGILLLKTDNAEGQVAKYERLGAFNDHSMDHMWYLDESNEFANYCGGSFPPLYKSDDRAQRRATWLLERTETRQVTLI